MTLAVNAGTLITYDRDALRRWQSRHRRVQSPAEFSSTVNTLASLFPGKVTTQ
jgi:predicted nucleic acid-binding protein